MILRCGVIDLSTVFLFSLFLSCENFAVIKHAAISFGLVEYQLGFYLRLRKMGNASSIDSSVVVYLELNGKNEKVGFVPLL